MLSPDLVQTRRRGEELKLVSFTAGDRERATELSREILYALSGLVGRTEEEVDLVLAGIECSPKDKKLLAGLTKLALDAVSFESNSELVPLDLRRLVFERAARERIRLGEGFDRGLLLSEIAREISTSVEELERALFADLKGAAELRHAPTIDAEALVETYIEAQLLSVFLRAVRVRAFLRLESPSEVRHLFWKLKFRQLLFRLEDEGEGNYRLELEGPSSLLISSTRYGLRFAQVIRALGVAGARKLEADVLWGKAKRPLLFRHTISAERRDADAEPDSWIRPELVTLLDNFAFTERGFTVRLATKIFHVPGLGVCVPDLEFAGQGKEPVFLELLGEWSRDAAFRRAEWARENPSCRIVFAASSRLRVSEEIMDTDALGSLLVYKGSLSAKKVLEMVEGVGARADAKHVAKDPSERGNSAEPKDPLKARV